MCNRLHSPTVHQYVDVVCSTQFSCCDLGHKNEVIHRIHRVIHRLAELSTGCLDYDYFYIVCLCIVRTLQCYKD